MTPPMLNEKLAIIDTETTDLWTVRPEDGSRDYSKVVVTDIGIILLNGILDQEPQRYEMSFKLSPLDLDRANPEALEISGYKHSERESKTETGSRVAAMGWRYIADLLQDRVIVASNAEFDLGAMRSNLTRHGVLTPKGNIPGEEWETWTPRRCIDTNAFGYMMKMAYGLKNASVQTSYDFLVPILGLPVLQGHRALADAEKTLAVLKFAYKRFQL